MSNNNKTPRHWLALGSAGRSNNWSKGPMVSKNTTHNPNENVRCGWDAQSMREKVRARVEGSLISCEFRDVIRLCAKGHKHPVRDCGVHLILERRAAVGGRVRLGPDGRRGGVRGPCSGDRNRLGRGGGRGAGKNRCSRDMERTRISWRHPWWPNDGLSFSEMAARGSSRVLKDAIDQFKVATSIQVFSTGQTLTTDRQAHYDSHNRGIGTTFSARPAFWS